MKEIKDLEEVCLFMSQKIMQNTFVVVCGEIGSGKTTFIKKFFSLLGIEENVNSPTFNVMKRYWSKKLNCFLNHFDFFMLKNEEDYLIFEEFKDGSVSVAEWGDKAKSFWIKEKNVFYLKINTFSDNSREFIIWNSINKK